MFNFQEFFLLISCFLLGSYSRFLFFQLNMRILLKVLFKFDTVLLYCIVFLLGLRMYVYMYIYFLGFFKFISYPSII